jgi:hypothetical protein
MLLRSCSTPPMRHQFLRFWRVPSKSLYSSVERHQTQCQNDWAMVHYYRKRMKGKVRGARRKRPGPTRLLLLWRDGLKVGRRTILIGRPAYPLFDSPRPTKIFWVVQFRPSSKVSTTKDPGGVYSCIFPGHKSYDNPDHQQYHQNVAHDPIGLWELMERGYDYERWGMMRSDMFYVAVMWPDTLELGQRYLIPPTPAHNL